MRPHRSSAAALCAVSAAILACGSGTTGGPGPASSSQLDASGAPSTTAALAPAADAPAPPAATLLPTETGWIDSSAAAVASAAAPAGDPAIETAIGGSAVAPASTATTPGAFTSGLGQFSVRLVDAPTNAVKAVVVKVTAVRAHVVGMGWVSLHGVTYPVEVDLLKLQGPHAAETAALLGFAFIPAGTVTQIRLLVALEDGANYVVLDDQAGTLRPLKVPSGYESGIKIKGPFEVAACSETAVTVDFDAHKSIWYHPTGRQDDEWILRPVIRLHGALVTPIACPDPSTPPGDTDGSGVPPPDQTPPPDPTPVPAPEPTPAPAPVAIGGACDATLVCESTLTCSSGTCVGSVGQLCSADRECISNSCLLSACAPGGAGASCTWGGECLSGTCNPDGTCEVGLPGAACRVSTDCTTTCDANSACAASATAATAGTACSAAAECMSNDCYEGYCQLGGQNAPCSSDLDCGYGLACSAGFCDAVGTK